MLEELTTTTTTPPPFLSPTASRAREAVNHDAVDVEVDVDVDVDAHTAVCSRELLSSSNPFVPTKMRLGRTKATIR